MPRPVPFWTSAPAAASVLPSGHKPRGDGAGVLERFGWFGVRLTGDNRPQQHGVIGTRRGQGLAVRHKGQRRHLGGVTAQRLQHRAFGGTPQLDGLILAAGYQGFAIRGVRQCRHRLGVPLERRFQLVTFRTRLCQPLRPQSKIQAVRAGRGRLLAVRGQTVTPTPGPA